MAYIILGIFIILMARNEKYRLIKLFGPANIFLGCASFIYHASYTLFFQFFDHVGMLMVIFLPLTSIFIRTGWVKKTNDYFFILAGFIVLTIAFPLAFWVHIPYQTIIFILTILVFILEVPIRYYYQIKTGFRYYWLAFIFQSTAIFFSMLDVKQIWCDPENHLIQGHAVWHVLSAIGLFFMFRFHQQAIGKYYGQ